jgi:hypothetical protein
VSFLVFSDGFVALVGGRFVDAAAPFRFLPSFFSFGVVVVLVLRCIDERRASVLVNVCSSWCPGSPKYQHRTYFNEQ